MTTNHPHDAMTRARSIFRRRYAVGVAATMLATIVSLQTRPAAAQVTCDARIGAGEVAVLTSNLSCPGAGPVVEGPGTLDLNGFVLRCTRSPSGFVGVGVRLEGTGATVRNGVVRDCGDGVLVAGDGRHLVQGVSVVSSRGTGIQVASNRNQVVDSFVFFAGLQGIDVSGRANLLARNAVTGAADAAFFVFQKNRLVANVASGAQVGFRVTSTGSVLNGNRAIGNDRGFVVTGKRNRFVANQGEGNTTGFFIDGAALATTLARNDLSGNERSGILVFGDGSKLRGNRSEMNGEHGILLFNAERTLVTRSVALNNGDLDLVDETVGCGTNRWRDNTFGSTDQACVR